MDTQVNSPGESGAEELFALRTEAHAQAASRAGVDGITQVSISSGQRSGPDHASLSMEETGDGHGRKKDGTSTVPPEAGGGGSSPANRTHQQFLGQSEGSGIGGSGTRPGGPGDSDDIRRDMDGGSRDERGPERTNKGDGASDDSKPESLASECPQGNLDDQSRSPDKPDPTPLYEPLWGGWGGDGMVHRRARMGRWRTDFGSPYSGRDARSMGNQYPCAIDPSWHL